MVPAPTTNNSWAGCCCQRQVCRGQGRGGLLGASRFPWQKSLRLSSLPPPQGGAAEWEGMGVQGSVGAPGPPGPQPSLLPCLNSLLSISHHGYLASKGGLLLPGLQYGAQALCWQPNPVSGAAGGGGFATDVALLQRRPGMGASGYTDGWE